MKKINKMIKISLSLLAAISLQANPLENGFNNNYMVSQNGIKQSGSVGSGFLDSPEVEQEVSNIDLHKEAVKRLDEIVKEISENQEFIKNSKINIDSFTKTIINYKTYVLNYIDGQARCQLLEDEFESNSFSKRVMEQNKKLVDRCYEEANLDLKVYDSLQKRTKKVYELIVDIDDEAKSKGIFIKSLIKGEAVLKAQIALKGEK